jgi:hypothetical protein
MIDYLTAISEMYQGKVVQYVGTVNGNIFIEDGAKMCMIRGVVFDYPVQKVARVPLYDPDFRYRLTGETVDTTIWPKVDCQQTKSTNIT